MTALLLYSPVTVGPSWLLLALTLASVLGLAVVAWAGDHATLSVKRVLLACALAGTLAALTAYDHRHPLTTRVQRSDTAIPRGCDSWLTWSIFCL